MDPIMNATINAATEQVQKVTVGDIIGKILFFSNRITSFIASKLNEAGLPLTQTQLGAILAIVLIASLILIIKFGEKLKPWLKIILIILIVWLILGFFVPLSAK